MKTKNAKELDSITFDYYSFIFENIKIFNLYLSKNFRELPAALIKRAFEVVFGVKVSKISLLHAL